MYFISLFSCLLESEQNRILDHGDSRDFGKKFCIGVTKYYIRKDTNVTFVCTFLLFSRVINFFIFISSLSITAAADPISGQCRGAAAERSSVHFEGGGGVESEGERVFIVFLYFIFYHFNQQIHVALLTAPPPLWMLH